MTEYTVHEEKSKGYTLRVKQDSDACSPRDCDNLGTMTCFHKGYSLGDAHKFSSPQSFLVSLWEKEATDAEKLKFILSGNKSISDYRYLIERNGKDLTEMFSDVADRFAPPTDFPANVIALPLYLYDHSGITMNTTGFSCRWDSGQVGYIYVTEKKLKEEGLGERTTEQVYERLKGEVETYDQYLTGDVYGVIVSKESTCDDCHNTEEEEVESYWGLYGIKDAIEEGKGLLSAYVTK